MRLDSLKKDIKVFRDDLYPFLGGGNKGRKSVYIERDIKKKECNAVVTTGGIESNHCRAIAIMAAKNGWDCTLVLHGEKEKFYASIGNAMFMRLSGAEIKFVEANEIGTTMDKAMEEYKAIGKSPYYIWGGGHTMEGGLAYIEAVGELESYCESESWLPEYVFLACGTGSTQAGIMAGLDRFDMPSEVIGISVARSQNKAESVVKEFYEQLCNSYEINLTGRNTIVLDDYLQGGYEKFGENLYKLSHDSIKDYGFCLDTTYSGKAFYGMLDYIERNDIKGNILFWHTGGILNFMANENTFPR